MSNKHGGKRPGAGRKTGSKNKSTVMMQEAIAKQLADTVSDEPLAVMIEIMNTPKPSQDDYPGDIGAWVTAVKGWLAMRLDAAAKAAPDRHARLSAVEASQDSSSEHIARVNQRLINEQPDG